MKTAGVVVFPNSRVELDGETVWTTEAVRDFVSCIAASGAAAMLAAASAPHTSGSRDHAIVSGGNGFRFFALGRALNHRSWLGKVSGYGTALLRILFRVPKRPLWYIFLPGHMGMLICCVSCLLGKRFGIYVRGDWPMTGIGGVLYRLYFKRAAFIITTGASFVAMLQQYNERVEEVAPMTRFRLEDLREKASYAVTGRARILFVGAIHPTKGVFEVVKALPAVTRRCDVELKIVGSGIPEVTAHLQAEIQASGCAGRIDLAGHVGDKQELAKAFASADLFVFPTYYTEGFPRVIYEAMGFGLPVVCTDIEGGRHFLRDNENCRIVAKKDVEGLTDCLIELLTNQPLRAKLGRRGFHEVRDLCGRFKGISHGSQVVDAIRAFDQDG